MLKVNKLTTMYDSCTIFIDVSAIEILDLWGKDENGDETNGYKKLAKQSSVHFPDKLKKKNYISHPCIHETVKLAQENSRTNCFNLLDFLERITFALISLVEKEEPKPSGKMTSTDPASSSFFPPILYV